MGNQKTPARRPTEGAVVVHAVRQHDDHTRALFRRYLSGWAMDLLELRRRGLDRPCMRDGAGAGPVSPGHTSDHDSGSPGALRPFAPAHLQGAFMGGITSGTGLFSGIDTN